MPRIKPANVGTATNDVKAVFDEIQQAFGMVPNLFRSYADFPPLLRANWEKVKAVMMQGVLERKTKEAIAVMVSKDNSCKYCVIAHSAILRTMGVSGEEVEQIINDIENSGFGKKELAIIGLARRANGDPHKITDKDFAEVTGAGVSQAEIIEALGVMELYTGFNKFLDSMQVEIDF